MSLYFWQPADDWATDCFRKQYAKSGKLAPYFPSHIKVCGGISNEELNASTYAEALHKVRSENLNWAFGSATHKPYEELRGVYTDKGKPILGGASGFRRVKAALNDELLTHTVLDFDKHIEGLLQKRTVYTTLDAVKVRQPILSNLELVAFFSSSMFYAQTPATRVNLHVVVFFDKPYTRETVARFHAHMAEDCDKAMAVITQPHFVANPLFLDTPPLDIPGLNDIAVMQGERLCLDQLDLPPANAPRYAKLTLDANALSDDESEVREFWLHKRRSGELDNEAHDSLYNAIFCKNFFNAGETESFVKALDDEEITREHDVWEMDSNAKFYIRKILNGDELSNSKHKTKFIHELDLANYDISDLPKENCVIVVKSGCGTGKTTGFVGRYLDHMKAESAIYVSRLLATLEPVCKSIPRFKYMYANGEDAEAKRHWMNSNPFMTTTDYGIDYLINNGMYRARDCFIIDEIERVAMNALDPHSKQDEIINIAADAKSVLLLDADASCDLTLWYAEQIASGTQKELLIITNGIDHLGENHNVYGLEKEEDAVNMIDTLLQKNKKAYVHVGFSDGTERKRISSLVRYLQHRHTTKKIIGYDRNSVPQLLRKDSDKFLNEEQPDVLIVSPWSKIGWDTRYFFDATVGIYPHTFMNALDIHQALRRPRLTKDHYCWITNNLPKRWDEHYYEKVRQKHEGLKMLEKSFAGALSDRVRSRIKRLETNIPFHFADLAREKGARYFHGYSVEGEDQKEIQHLLTQHGEEEYEKQLKASWESITSNDLIKSRFYYWKKEDEAIYEFSEGRDWIKGTLDSITYEEFRELYARDLKISKSEADIQYIAKMWFQTVGERVDLDTREPRYLAILTGQLLDEVDRVISTYFGERTDSFSTFLKDSHSESLEAVLTDNDFRSLKRFIEDYYGYLEPVIPWLRGKHKQSHTLFLKDMADFLDLQFEEIERALDTNVSIERERIIRHYMKIGEIKKQRGKTTAITKKIEQINNRIDEKMINGLALSNEEKRWIPFRGRYFIFRKNTYRSRVIEDAIYRIAS